jgi:hypothetical protein
MATAAAPDDLKLASRLVRVRTAPVGGPSDDALWQGMLRSLEREPDQSIYRILRHRGSSFLDAAAAVERMRAAGLVEVVRKRKGDDRVRLLPRPEGLMSRIAEVEAMAGQPTAAGPAYDDPLWGRVVQTVKVMSEQSLGAVVKRLDAPLLDVALVLRVLRDAGLVVFTESQHSERVRLSPEGRELAARFSPEAAGRSL